MTLRVAFEDAESSEVLIYSGETIEAPCDPNGGYQPIRGNTSGTSTPFHVTTTTDSDAIWEQIEGRCHTITLMDIYSHKSIDELRCEDYEYKNANQGDGKVTLRSFSAEDSSTTWRPTSAICLPDSSTFSPLPSAFPAHTDSSTTRSSGAKAVPDFNSSGSVKLNQRKFRKASRKKRIQLKKSLPEISSNACKNSSMELPSAVTFDFVLTPSVSFKSDSDPATVLSPPQPSAVGKEPPKTLPVSEGQQLSDALLQSIVKCMQIQNSLYRLLLLKLQTHVIAAADAQTDPQCSMASDFTKVPRVKKAEILNDGAGEQHITKEATASPHGVSQVPTVKSERESPDDTSEYFNVDSKGLSISKELNLIDAAEASITESTGKSPNDSSKNPTTVSSGKKLSDFRKASIQENAIEGLKHVAEAFCSLGTSSFHSPDADLFQMERSRESLNDSTIAMLCGIKEPLEALVHCADVQRSLYQNILTVNVITNEGAMSDSSDKRRDKTELEFDNEEHVDMLEVQSKLEKIALKARVECSYARDPFSSQHLKPSTSEDVLQHISVRKRPFSLGFDGDFTSVRELPHGRGTLKTTSGELLYSGNWCKGQRHGKGEGLILSLSDGSHFTAQHGFYIGQWKHNMRHGRGKMLFSSDAVYEGQWKFDKMTGYGTLKLPDGTIQEGTWREGALHGCAVFIWPHGVTEYREYDVVRGQLSSCKIEKETAETLSRMRTTHSQLLKARECAITELRDEKSFLTEQLNALKEENAAMFTKVHAYALEIRKNFEEQWEIETRKQRSDLEKALKEAEATQLKGGEEAAKLRKELEETKGALMCQICFTRPRDCIILPCSHLLYCRVCVNEHKSRGNLRCPTCRGTINSEILCNVNHSSETLS